MELAERHTQPVGRADLHDRVHRQIQELAFAQAGASQELDGEAHERIWVGSGGYQQLGSSAIVQEAGQRLIWDGKSPAKIGTRAGASSNAPFEEAFEEAPQGAETIADGVSMPSVPPRSAGRAASHAL